MYPNAAAVLVLLAIVTGGAASSEQGRATPGTLAVLGSRAAMRLVPTPTPTPSPAPTNTPLPTKTPTPRLEPTNTPTPTPTAVPTNTPTLRLEPTATPTPRAALEQAPMRRVLGPMVHEYQRMNNCAPVAVQMTLSYFGVERAQAAVAYDLRPSPDDVSVNAGETAAYMRGQGLHAMVRLGGTPQILRALLANDIPVMAPHLLNDHEDIGHFTVVRGYDRAADTLIINDSYYGPSRVLSVSAYLRLWDPYERIFVPVYRPAQAPIVREILGADWDAQANAERYVRQQRAVVDADPSAETWMSLGYGLYVAGEYDGAVDAYRTAVRYGLSRRTLWYTAWPAAALNQLGAHTEALSLANSALTANPASSEMLTERGNAEAGLGNRARAEEAWNLANRYAPYLAAAREAAAGS